MSLEVRVRESWCMIEPCRVRRGIAQARRGTDNPRRRVEGGIKEQGRGQERIKEPRNRERKWACKRIRKKRIKQNRQKEKRGSIPLGGGSDRGSSLRSLDHDRGGGSRRGNDVLSNLLLDGAGLLLLSGSSSGGGLGLLLSLLGLLVEESTKLAAQTTAELDLLSSHIGSGSISLGRLVNLDVLGLLSSGGNLSFDGGSGLFDGSRSLLYLGRSSLLGSLSRSSGLLDGSSSGSLLGDGLLLSNSGLLLLGGLLLDGTDELAEERLALLLLGSDLLGGLLGLGLLGGRLSSGGLFDGSDRLGGGGGSLLYNSRGSLLM